MAPHSPRQARALIRANYLKSLYIPPVIIRPAISDDRDAVVEIMNQAIQEQRNAFLEPMQGATAEDWYAQWLQNISSLVVDDETGRVVAWGNLSAYRKGRGALAGVAEITFYVHQNHRGKGIGKALVLQLHEVAVIKSYRYMLAILLDDNPASKGLLEAQGYQVTGHLTDIAHFPDGSRGQLYMSCALET